MNIAIRPATAADASTLADFNVRMALETEGLALDRPTVAAGVLAMFDDASRGQYFVAAIAGQIVGQLMITYEWSDWRNGNLWWIQSVYVHPDSRRRGVFATLYHHVENLARKAHAPTIRLYMHQANKTALAAYQRLGLDLTHYVVLEKPLPPPATG